MKLLLLQITVALALLCTSFACAMWLFFRRSHVVIGQRVGYMLFGEFISGGVFTVFATLELTDHLRDFPILYSTGLRWLALLFMLRSSVLLSVETARILSEDSDNADSS